MRLAHDKHPIEELQALAHEYAEIDEVLVLRPSPPFRDRFLLEPCAHRATLPGTDGHRQCPDRNTLVREVGEEWGAEVALAEGRDDDDDQLAGALGAPRDLHRRPDRRAGGDADQQSLLL